MSITSGLALSLAVFLSKPLYLISILILFFITNLFLALTKNKSRTDFIFSHLITVTLLFLLSSVFELIFQFTLHNQPQLQDIKDKVLLKRGIVYDKRAKLKVVKDFRDQGIEAYPTFRGPPLYAQADFLKEKLNFDFSKESIHPLSGLSKTFTVICNEDGKWQTATTDRYGFNNSDEVYNSQLPLTVLVGDSFVYGECVDSNNTMGALLNQKKIPTSAMGVSGGGMLSHLAVLREYAVKVKPKNIIWIHFANDNPNDLSAELKTPFLNSYLDQTFSQKLIERQNEIDDLWKKLEQARYKYFPEDNNPNEFWSPRADKSKIKPFEILMNIIKFVRIRTILAPSESVVSIDQDLLKAAKKILVQARNVAHKDGINFYFVYLPYCPLQAHDPFYDELKRILIQENINFLDISEEFRNIEKKGQDLMTYYPLGVCGHFNKAGYQFIVEKMINKFNLVRNSSN